MRITRALPLVFLILFAGAGIAQPAGNSPGSISQVNNQLQVTYFGIEGAGGGSVTIVLKICIPRAKRHLPRWLRVPKGLQTTGGYSLLWP